MGVPGGAYAGFSPKAESTTSFAVVQGVVHSPIQSVVRNVVYTLAAFIVFYPG